MKPPYIKLYKDLGEIQAYIVDGEFRRKHDDIDFTDYAHHYSYIGGKGIPENQFFIDQDSAPEEYPFFLDALIREYHLIKNEGKSANDARLITDKIVQRERAKALHLTPKDLGDLTEKALIKHLWTINNVDVFLVHGEIVRAVDNSYSEGGHSRVYDYVKKPEGKLGAIWLDDAIAKRAWKLILLHEYHEFCLMKWFDYDTSHFRASAVELHCRNHEEDLDFALEYTMKFHDKQEYLIGLLSVMVIRHYNKDLRSVKDIFNV